MGRPDFGLPTAHPAPLVAHALHDDDIDRDVVEALARPKLAFPLRCRWRVPLTWVHNPSGVLLLYRDPLDA